MASSTARVARRRRRVGLRRRHLDRPRHRPLAGRPPRPDRQHADARRHRPQLRRQRDGLPPRARAVRRDPLPPRRPRGRRLGGRLRADDPGRPAERHLRGLAARRGRRGLPPVHGPSATRRRPLADRGPDVDAHLHRLRELHGPRPRRLARGRDQHLDERRAARRPDAASATSTATSTRTRCTAPTTCTSTAPAWSTARICGRS